MDLYSILACPWCKVAVERRGDSLLCPDCSRTYPIVNGVPVMLPDGSVPETVYQHQLHVRAGYDPWLHRVVLQSLPASAVVLDLGAGNQTLDLPNVVRMDVTLTPYVDVVGDAHAMPFLPGTFDFVFSLAVFEHLRQPFVAAEEIYTILKDGGYAYNECNFVFAYHGFPYHFFNASQQGLEEVFARYEKLRSSVAPYQMPSQSLRMFIKTYLEWMQPGEEPRAQAFRMMLEEVGAQPLRNFDAHFTEQGALYVAAGVFFFGRKALTHSGSVLPEVVMQAWEHDAALRERFANPFDLGHADNLLLWAKGEGRRAHPEIEAYFAGAQPFHKHEQVDEDAVRRFEALPVDEPLFGNIPEEETAEGVEAQRVRSVDWKWVEELQTRRIAAEAQAEELQKLWTESQDYMRELETEVERKNSHISRLEAHIRTVEGGRLMRLLKRVGR